VAKTSRRQPENEEENDNDEGVSTVLLKKAPKPKGKRTVVRKATLRLPVEDEAPKTTSHESSISYSKESLEEMMREQQAQQPKEVEKETGGDLRQAMKPDPLPEVTQSQNEEAYISLDGTISPSTSLPRPSDRQRLVPEPEEEIPINTEIVDDENSEWQSQVTRRAQIKLPDTTPVSVPLQELRQQLQQTLETLEARDQVPTDTLQTNAALDSARKDHERYRNALENDLGPAFEYYQSLRASLIDWVGALRSMDTKWPALHEAATKVQGNLDFVDWSQDVAQILSNAGYQIEVIGAEVQAEETVHVDEFGRSLPSRQSIQREARWKRRKFGWTEEERERLLAWKTAAQLVTQEFRPELQEWTNLLELFVTWQRNYPEDYKECFASMTLGDLLAVVLRMKLWLEWMQEEPVVTLDWIGVLKTNRHLLGESGFEPIINKAIAPFVDSALGQFTTDDAWVQVGPLVLEIVNKLGPHPPATTSQLSNVIVYLIQRRLESLVAVVPSTSLPATHINEMTLDALRYTNDYIAQVQRLQSIVEDMLTNLVPVNPADERLQESVLTFVSCKYIPLLSGLDDKSKARASFESIWLLLKPLGWLDKDSHLALTMPIQAAASVYRS